MVWPMSDNVRQYGSGREKLFFSIGYPVTLFVWASIHLVVAIIPRAYRKLRR